MMLSAICLPSPPNQSSLWLTSLSIVNLPVLGAVLAGAVDCADAAQEVNKIASRTARLPRRRLIVRLQIFCEESVDRAESLRIGADLVAALVGIDLVNVLDAEACQMLVELL